MEERNDQGRTAGAAALTLDASGVPVVELTGEIDISNVDQIRPTIERAVEHSPPQVVFDLGGLDFMDSSGIALLLLAAAKAGSVHLRQPSSIVRRIVEVTGLSDVLHIDA